MAEPAPTLAAYGSASLTEVIPALFGVTERERELLPPAARDAASVVLLAVDGLGASALERHAACLPTLVAMDRAVITSVLPATTAAALTSLTTAAPPTLPWAGGLPRVRRWQGAQRAAVAGGGRSQQQPRSRRARNPARRCLPWPADPGRHEVGVPQDRFHRRAPRRGGVPRLAHGERCSSSTVAGSSARGSGWCTPTTRVSTRWRTSTACTTAFTRPSCAPPTGSSRSCSMCCPRSARSWSPPTTDRSTWPRTHGSTRTRSCRCCTCSRAMPGSGTCTPSPARPASSRRSASGRSAISRGCARAGA